MLQIIPFFVSVGTTIWKAVKKTSDVATPVITSSVKIASKIDSTIDGFFSKIPVHLALISILKKFPLVRPLILVLLTFFGYISEQQAIVEFSSPEITLWNIIFSALLAVTAVSIYFIGKLYIQEFKEKRTAKVEADKRIIVGKAELDLEKQRTDLELYKKARELDIERKHVVDMAKAQRKAKCIEEGKTVKECKINTKGQTNE